MKKIFVDEPIDGDVILSGDDHVHVSVVLRAKKGDKLVLCDGSGYDFLFEITDIDRSSTKLGLISKSVVETEPKSIVDLFAAPLKADKFEWAIQKCTELGINSVIPIITEYGQVRTVRLDRLNKITKEAANQCGRGKVPKVLPPVRLKDLTDVLSSYDNVLFFYEKGGCELGSAIKTEGGRTAIIIGGEGGFSDEEAKLLARIAPPVSLGKRILRAETACVAATALVMYELKEMQ